MKTIIGLLLMGMVLIGSGAGAYTYLSKASTIAPQNYTAKQPLDLLVDDCFVMYAQECLPGRLQTSEEGFIRVTIEDWLRTHNRNDLIGLVRTPKEQTLRLLDPDSQLTPITYTFPASIARVSELTRIHYKMLMALTALSANSWASNGIDTNADPLAEMYQVAISLRENFLSSTSITHVRVGQKEFRFATSLNPGSKAVYLYLASVASSPAEFEEWIGVRESSRSLPATWRLFFGEAMVTASPFHLPSE